MKRAAGDQEQQGESMNRKLSAKEESVIKKYVQEKLREADLAHGPEHAEYVVHLAKRIGAAEGADLRIVAAAAYLHDVVDRSRVHRFADHAEASAKEAEQLLHKLKFGEEDIAQVERAIIASSYSSHERGVEPETLEARVVRDADWLDAMGARGVARVFATSGRYGSKEMGEVLWDPRNPVKLRVSLSGLDPSPIYHFFSKLLWLRDEMLTETGRKLAEKRHQFMVSFLTQYKRESPSGRREA